MVNMEVRDIAIQFIKTLSASEKERLKTMLEHGIVCGVTFARQHGITPEQMTAELKSIFEVK